eukprot:350937-Rhodomonas_salina.1
MKIRRRMPVSALPSYSPLDAIRVALCKATAADANISWGHVCKTFIIMNVMQEDPAAAVTGLLQDAVGSSCPGRDEIGAQVARHLMGFRNSTAEHQETLITLLTTYIQIRKADVQKLFDASASTTSDKIAGVQALFLQRLRPSMSCFCLLYTSPSPRDRG